MELVLASVPGSVLEQIVVSEKSGLGNENLFVGSDK